MHNINNTIFQVPVGFQDLLHNKPHYITQTLNLIYNLYNIDINPNPNLIEKERTERVLRDKPK